MSNKYLDYLLVIAGLIVIMTGLRTYYIGAHNMDNAYNLAELNRESQHTYLDRATNGNHYKDYKIHNMGLIQTEKGLYISMAGLFVFTEGLFYMLWRS